MTPLSTLNLLLLLQQAPLEQTNTLLNVINIAVVLIGGTIAWFANNKNKKEHAEQQNERLKQQAQLNEIINNLKDEFRQAKEADRQSRDNLKTELLLNQEKMKTEFMTIIDGIKRDFPQQFVPQQFDIERRQNLLQRLSDLEHEKDKLRENMHGLANKFSEFLLGKMDRVDTQMQEKIRKMTRLEDKMDAIEKILDEYNSRVGELERIAERHTVMLERRA